MNWFLPIKVFVVIFPSFPSPLPIFQKMNRSGKVIYQPKLAFHFISQIAHVKLHGLKNTKCVSLFFLFFPLVYFDRWEM